MNGWAPPAAGSSRSRLDFSDHAHQEEEEDYEAPPCSLQPDFAPPKAAASAYVGLDPESDGDSLTETTEGDPDIELAPHSDAGEAVPEEESDAVVEENEQEDDHDEPDLDDGDGDYDPGVEGLLARYNTTGARRSSRSGAAGQAQLGFALPPPPARSTQDPPSSRGYNTDEVSSAPYTTGQHGGADVYEAYQDEHDPGTSILSDRNATPGRPYGCSFEGCTKAFSRRSDLVRHYRIHANSRPFECPVCHKSFIQRSALTVHERTHTGERPHHCEICNRPFADSSSLARHRRVHSGEKPYKCGLCSKEFCRKITLDKHYNKHHAPDRDQRLAAEIERRRLAAAERERKKLLKLERLHEERRKRQKHFGEDLAREYRLPPPSTGPSTSKPGPSRYGPYAPGYSTSRRWKTSTSSSSQSESAAQQAASHSTAVSSFPRYPSHFSRLEVEGFVPAPPAGTFFAPANSRSHRSLRNDFQRPIVPATVDPPSRSRAPLYLTDEYGQRYEVDEYGNAISDETMHWDVPEASSAHYTHPYDQTSVPQFAYPDSSHRTGTQSWQPEAGAGQPHFFAAFDQGSGHTSNAPQHTLAQAFAEPHLGSVDTWIAPIRDPLPPDAAPAFPALPSIDPSLAQDSHFGSELRSELPASHPTPDLADGGRQPILTREQLPDWLRSPRRPASFSPVAEATLPSTLNAQPSNGETPRPRNRHYGLTSPLSSLAQSPGLRYSPENGSSRSWYDVAPLHASPPTSHLTSAGARYGQLGASPSALRQSR